MKLGMTGADLTQPFRLLRVLGPMLLLLGVLGLVVACGGDDPTATPTATTPSADGGDGGSGDDGGSGSGGDDGGAAAYTGLSADFASKQIEINMPAYRHTAWNATTLKRLIEEEYPNVTVTLNASTTNEVLQDVDRVDGYRAGAFMVAPTAQWVLHRAGIVDVAIPEGVPDPVQPAFAGWGVYPMSQYIIQAMGDSGIISTADLDGRTFLPGQYANDPRTVIQLANIEATGAKPRVVYSTQRSDEALLEGVVDSAHSGMVYQVSLAGAGVALAQQNEIRIVDHPVDAINKVRAENPDWRFNIPMRMCNSPLKQALSIDYDIILPGSMDIGGDNCIGGVGGLGLGTWVFEDMDPDVMYIMVRTQIEHADEFLTVYPGAPWVGTIWTEIFGHYVLPQEFFHPGAAAAYEEFGKSYGIEGRTEWLSERTDSDQWWQDYLPE